MKRNGCYWLIVAWKRVTMATFISFIFRRTPKLRSRKNKKDVANFFSMQKQFFIQNLLRKIRISKKLKMEKEESLFS